MSLRTETVWADGTIDDLNVETIQPPQWIAEHNAQISATVPIPLELVEMGLPEEMTATVVANEKCPEIEDGPGRVVLTTVNHLNNDVWELTVEAPNGQAETVRPTGLHKFYRPVDDAWVSTKDLKVGDELQGADGPIIVRRVAKIPGVHRVYNMTVEGEHVYRVSSLGALVHNNGCAQPHLNNNDAVSRFGVYEIDVNGAPFKFGKADLNRITQSSGLPTRVHQQVRKLEEIFGRDVAGKVIQDLGETTTEAAKAAERARILQSLEETGFLPIGNWKSF